MARSIAHALVLGLAFLTACTAPAQPKPLPGDLSRDAGRATDPAPAAAGNRAPGQAPAGQQAGTMSPLPAPVTALATEPLRAAPTRPVQLWPFTKFRGEDYVAMADIAKRYGLKAAWTKPHAELTLRDARGARLVFEKDQRDFQLDGARVFMGELAVSRNDDLWVTKIDVIKTIAPLFAPADHAAFLPAPPKTIVIDPGHGGTDPGKQNPRLKLDEKDMALDVALRLKKILESRGYRVVMTRTTDKRFSNSPAVDLPLRAEVANKENADLFVSIHFNAVDHDPERVVGTETYVMTPQFQLSTQPEQDRAMAREQYPGNRQDVANAVLGYQIHRQVVADLKTSDRGYKRYRLAVLRPLHCPGVLVEAAYLSNDAEARRVATPEFRARIAESLAEGIGNYAAVLAALRPAPRPANP
jgi:N-acetylmuramoyl-L-alanine amidase